MQKITIDDVKLKGITQCSMRSITETQKAIYGRTLGIDRCGLCQCKIPPDSHPFEIEIPGRTGYVCSRCADRLKEVKNGK